MTCQLVTSGYGATAPPTDPGGAVACAALCDAMPAQLRSLMDLWTRELIFFVAVR